VLNYTPKSNELKSPLIGDEKQQPASRNCSMSPHNLSHIMQLQRTIGNRAVSQMLQSKRVVDQKHSEIDKVGNNPILKQNSGAGMSGNLSAKIQRAISHDDPDYEDDKGRAGKVTVENIKGKSLGPGANAPSVDPIGWRELHDGGHTLGHAASTGYRAVRMHLWNGRLNGPGDEVLNLAPGPAQINSLMSAGPEQSAKDAVDKKRTIWLETEVSYQNDNVQANDFTSVVPNEISMEWGYMTGGTRGPAQVIWSQPIDQPAGALTKTQKKAYRKLNTVHNLKGMLQNASKQEIAQAYNLVNDDLKKHMLLNYETVFMGMTDDDRKQALSRLDENEIIKLINLLGYADDHIAINYYVLNNLKLKPLLLQNVFKKFDDYLKYKIAYYVGEDLLFDLDEYGMELVKTENVYFNILSSETKFNFLDNMYDEEIDHLFLARTEYNLFEDWARFHGNNDYNKAKLFFEDRVSDELYEKLVKRVLKFWQNKKVKR